MKHIYFVRHGETTWNAEKKLCGVTDVELTETGHEQAIMTGELIKERGYKADCILYSPLKRAANTAMHIAEITGIPAKEEPRLVEQSFGIWEGTARKGGGFDSAKKHSCSRFETGESLLHVAQRIYNLLDELKEDNKTYILVGHNGLSRVIRSYFYEMTNEEFSDFSVKNCEVVEYTFDE